MKKILLTFIITLCFTGLKAQYPEKLSADYYISTLGDSLKIRHHETDKSYVAKLTFTESCILNDYSLYAMSLLTHLGKGYKPYKDGRVYYIYPNGNVVTYDSNGVYFVKNK
jgi:hypothetical protein